MQTRLFVTSFWFFFSFIISLQIQPYKLANCFCIPSLINFLSTKTSELYKYYPNELNFLRASWLSVQQMPTAINLNLAACPSITPNIPCNFYEMHHLFTISLQQQHKSQNAFYNINSVSSSEQNSSSISVDTLYYIHFIQNQKQSEHFSWQVSC